MASPSGFVCDKIATFLGSESNSLNALILSKDNPEWLFDALAMEIEDLRLKAIDVTKDVLKKLEDK